MRPQPTADDFRRNLSYDPLTGIFTKLRYGAGEPAGWVGTHGYIFISIKKKRYAAHRLAWFWTYGVWPQLGLDHINGVTDDNRIENLREATQQQNLFNSRLVRKNSKYRKGVSFDRAHKAFRADITLNGKQKHLGRYPTLEQAVSARVAAEKQYCAEFARLAP